MYFFHALAVLRSLRFKSTFQMQSPSPTPFSFPWHSPAVFHTPEHSQQCRAQVLQVRQDSRMTPLETMNFSFGAKTPDFLIQESLRANIHVHPSQSRQLYLQKKKKKQNH